MKKYLLFLLTLLVFCSLKTTDAMAASEDKGKTNMTTEFHLAKSRKDTSSLDLLAAEHLNNIKSQYSHHLDLLEVLGLSAEELEGASLGNAFTPYVFDKNGQVISDGASVYGDLAYPVIYNGKIIAILEMGYDSAASKYTYTFGKAYADKLEQILHTGNIDSAKGLIIGRIADKFFLTDGVHMEIISDKRANLFSQPDEITKEELETLCSKLPQAVNASYDSIGRPAVQSAAQKNITEKEAKKLVKTYLKKSGKWKTGYVLAAAKKTTPEKIFKIEGEKAYRFELRDSNGKKQGRGKLVARYAVRYDGGKVYRYVSSEKKYVEQGVF